MPLTPQSGETSIGDIRDRKMEATHFAEALVSGERAAPLLLMPSLSPRHVLSEPIQPPFIYIVWVSMTRRQRVVWGRMDPCHPTRYSSAHSDGMPPKE